jgi:hypothetical protein
VGTLGHVLEAGGLATVALSLVRGQIERTHPPRALHCEFPLGRPLGRPNDPGFQCRVLLAALGLLARPSGPVLEDFPGVIADEADEPLACPLPPRLDTTLPAAVDEVLGLRPAYDWAVARSGRTMVGRCVTADGVARAVEAFVRIAAGEPWDTVGLPGAPSEVVLDIRAYYEEAALALADHVPAARAAESWLYRTTATGRVLCEAQAKMRDGGAPGPVWFYVVPVSQQQSS